MTHVLAATTDGRARVLLLRDAAPIVKRCTEAFPEAITEADLTLLGLGLGTAARSAAETLNLPPVTAELFTPPPFTQAWARGRHATYRVVSYLNMVCEFLTTGNWAASVDATLVLASPMSDVVPWAILLGHSQVAFAFPVTRTMLGYWHLDHGWAYLAAGLSPQEAVGVPVEDALTMAALRGITLPHPDSL